MRKLILLALFASGCSEKPAPVKPNPAPAPQSYRERMKPQVERERQRDLKRAWTFDEAWTEAVRRHRERREDVIREYNAIVATMNDEDQKDARAALKWLESKNYFSGDLTLFYGLRETAYRQLIVMWDYADASVCLLRDEPIREHMRLLWKKGLTPTDILQSASTIYPYGQEAEEALECLRNNIRPKRHGAWQLIRSLPGGEEWANRH